MVNVNDQEMTGMIDVLCDCCLVRFIQL